MSGEAAFIDLLRGLARDPAARGLMDDAAVLPVGGERLILTSDMIVEGVHFLPADPPADIGWKLAAVNLSDLAAKGARPVACLMNYALSGDAGWDAAFLGGLREALEAYAMPLVGGDTVAMPSGAPRVFTLTAMGLATSDIVPARGGAKAGDRLFVTGSIGDAGAGLTLLQQGESAPASLIAAYRRPQPRLAEGCALAPHVHAMMDISDGLLIDAGRMAGASGLGARITHVPLSPALADMSADLRAAALMAACAGDDYQLLCAAPMLPDCGFPMIAVGELVPTPGLTLEIDGKAMPLPERLGYEHGCT
ncbi:thiamine-phosphate kinase [Sphingobium aquiterrae]|uniref:thiamine-phosphate kinase n=1 Tax=Sphingobium aquiterrae TaxID=2038656 RepID=UPI00301804A1